MSRANDLFKIPHVEGAFRRVKVLFGGQYIVDTDDAKLVWLKPSYPVYFFEEKDLSEKYLSPSENFYKGKQEFDIVVGERKALGAATKYTDGDLKGLITITFDAMDSWFEEDEEIFVHPKDPYKRVDVLQSSRHVQVKFKGHVLADSKRAWFLHETGLRIRTYIPKADCNMELLVASHTTSQCPYKGIANYYSVCLPDGTEEADSVWWYRLPNLECIQIRNLAAFYDEKFDVYIDGQLQKK
ncbi:DUF427 domain-containing protein [Phanerochaete sordida]|uniref:DUF427 domain-containing protein n=1 Tax=Phanerochaete sordida TaxID=48140 RepID=A0A9P3GEV6_9APHY|nr:DUF427 domain-containing protein [Phanerochaete sordida]